MDELNTRLMANTLRAQALIGRHPGLHIGFSEGDGGSGLRLYEARLGGQLVEVDSDLGVLLNLLEAGERPRYVA